MEEALLPEKDARNNAIHCFGAYDPALQSLKKICKKSVWLFGLLLISGTAWAQTFTGTGVWSDAARWGGTVPAVGANVTINGDCTIDISSPASINVGDITINVGAILTITRVPFTLSVNNDWTNNGTFNAGTSTVSLQGTAGTDAVIFGTTTFNNLNAPGAIKNNLTIFSGAVVTVTGTNNINLSGNLSVIGSFTTNNGTINVGGDVSIPNATSSFNASNSTINARQTLTNSGTFTAGTSTVNFTTGSTATVNGTNASTTSFNNVTINKPGGIFDTPATFTVNGNLTIDDGIVNAGTSINVGGNFDEEASPSSTFNVGTSIINLTGTANSLLSTDDALYDVSINKIGGASVTPSVPGGIGGTISIGRNLTINTAPLGTTGGLSFATNNIAVNVLGNLSVSSGQITLTANDNNQLSVAGITSVSGGSILASRSASTVAVSFNGGLNITIGGVTVGGLATFNVVGNTSITNTGLLTATTTTPLTFNGDVALANGGVRFASNSVMVRVFGNWSSTVLGNFTYINSLVILEGNTNTTITGATQFARLRINKAATNTVTNSSTPFNIANTLNIQLGTIILSPASNSMSVRGDLLIESTASLDMGNPGINVFLGGNLEDQNSVEPSNIAPNRRGLYIGGGDGSASGYTPINPAISARPTITFDGISGDQIVKGYVQLRNFANSLLAGKMGIALPNVVIDKAADTVRFNSFVNVRVHGNLTINNGGLNPGIDNTLYFGDESSDEILINTNGSLVFPVGSGLRMNGGGNADGSFLKVNGGKLSMIGSSSQPVTVNRDAAPGNYYRMAALSGSVEVIYTTFNFQGANNTGFPDDPNDPKVTDGDPSTIPDWHTNASRGGFKIYSSVVIDPNNKGYNFSYCVLGANAAGNTTSLTINTNQNLNIIGTTFNTSGSGGINCVNNTDPATAIGVITFFQSKGELGGVYGEGNDGGFNDANVVWLTNTFMYWVGNYSPAGFRSAGETHAGSSTAWSNPLNWTLGGGLDANFLPVPPSSYDNPQQVFPGQTTFDAAQLAAFDPDGAGPLATPADTLQKFEVFIAASAPTDPILDANYIIQGTVINNSTGPGGRFDIFPRNTGNYGTTLNINGRTLEVYSDFVNNSRNEANSADINAGIINTTAANSQIIFRSNFASFNNPSTIITGPSFLFTAVGNATLQEVKVRINDLQEFKIDKPQGMVRVQGFGGDRLDVRGNLTIASGTLDMATGTPLLVNGDFNIINGGFISNTSTVIVRGNWNNTGGTVNFASGTINFYPATATDKIIRSNGQSFNVVNFGMISTSSCPTPYLNTPFTGSTGSPGSTKYTLKDNFTATGLTTVAARGQITGSLNDAPTVNTTTDPVQIRTIETDPDITVTLNGLRIRENGTFTAGLGVTVLNANNSAFYGLSSSINPFGSALSPIGILVEPGATTATNGRLNVLGSPANYAKISRDPSKVTMVTATQSYRFRVEGTISAKYYLIEYMNSLGINLSFASSIVARPPAPWDVKKGDPTLPLADPVNTLAVNDLGAGLSSNPYAGSFSDGILTNGVISGGVYIQYQSASGTFGAAPDTIFNASFPVPLTSTLPNTGKNIRRNSAACPGAATEVLWFRDATGAFAGEDFDYDGTAVCGTDPIQWKSRPLRRWDGNGLASNTAWHDPLNWLPDGVPLPTEDVILDRSILDAQYTVEITNATSTYIAANPAIYGAGATEVKVNSLRIDNSDAPVNLTNNDGTKIITLNIRNSRDLTLVGSYTAVTPTTFEATAVLNVSASGTIIEVGGNWSNRGTYNNGNSKVILGAGFTGSRVILSLPEPTLTVPSNAFYNLEMATGRTELNSALYVVNNIVVSTPVAATIKTKFDASLGNQPIYIQGNWLNGGRFLPQQGFVTFTGPTAQTVTQIDTVENFYGLAIDKVAEDVTLNSRTVVSRRLGSIPSLLFGQQPGGLSLTSGRFIATTGKEMIVDQNTPIQRVGAPIATTAYVKGPLGRVFSGTGSNNSEYIVGDTEYPNAPVTLTMNALTNTDTRYGTVFTVEQIDKDPDEGYDPGDPMLGGAASSDRLLPDPFNMISKSRYWKVKNIMFPDTAPLGSNADLVSGKIDLPLAPEFQTIDTTSTDGYLNVSGKTIDDELARISELSIVQDNANSGATSEQNLRGLALSKGTDWLDLGGVLNASTDGIPPTITSQNFTTLGNGEFSFAWNYTPLPVELISFKAQASNKHVDVEWITAMEENTSHFIVERSLDGKNFEAVGKVDAKIAANTIAVYPFKDKAPYQGMSYYRLKIIDRDGLESYSKIASVMMEVKIDGTGNITVFPNPSNGKTLNIVLESGQNEELQVRIYDLLGKIVYDKGISITNSQFIVLTLNERLPQGVYLLQLTTAQKIYQKRLIVK